MHNYRFIYFIAITFLTILPTSHLHSKPISAGLMHSLVIDEEGKIFTFGQNRAGECGTDDINTKWLPVQISLADKVVSVAAGESHSLALNSKGQVYSFGSGSHGESGHEFIGFLNPSRLLDLPPIVEVAAGDHFSLLLDDKGIVYSFGQGADGKNGNEKCKNTFIPAQITNVQERFIAISAGNDHSLLLKENGDVYTFGSNKYAQLGLSDDDMTVYWGHSPQRIRTLSNIIAIEAGPTHSLALDHSGDVYSFGYNSKYQTGHDGELYITRPRKIESLKNIVAIAAGNSTSLFLDHAGFVYSVGSSNTGDLGQGNNHECKVPTRIEGLPPIVAMSAGSNHSLLVDFKGRLYSFGLGQDGQLGLGYEDDNQIKNLPTIVDFSSRSTRMMLPLGYRKWKSQNHFSFPLQFKKEVFSFLLAMRKIGYPILKDLYPQIFQRISAGYANSPFGLNVGE